MVSLPRWGATPSAPRPPQRQRLEAAVGPRPGDPDPGWIDADNGVRPGNPEEQQASGEGGGYLQAQMRRRQRASRDGRALEKPSGQQGPQQQRADGDEDFLPGTPGEMGELREGDDGDADEEEGVVRIGGGDRRRRAADEEGHTPSARASPWRWRAKVTRAAWQRLSSIGGPSRRRSSRGRRWNLGHERAGAVR